MLFHVEMLVQLPSEMPQDAAAKLKEEERELALQLQKAGKWRHLWRVAGQYANVSIFDVESPDELNDILFSLPLFRFMTVKVTPLCQHPSALAE